MKLLLLLSAAVAQSSAFHIPFFSSSQRPFVSTDPAAEIPSDNHAWYEQLTAYFPPPAEYYDSLHSHSELADFDDADDFSDEDDRVPSLVEKLVLGIEDLKDKVEGLVDNVGEAIEEAWASEEVEDEDEDAEYSDVSDSDSDSDDEEELVEPPEGSIWDAAFPEIPHPHLPEKPHLPDKPDLPKKPELPKKPHLPGKPHLPKKPKFPKHPHPPFHRPHPPHRKGPNPHFKYINHTILEFLANSSHHKILYHLVKNDSSLISLFNSTVKKGGEITLFAPTDRAFHKIIEHLPKNHTRAPKWLIKKVIEYHTVGSFFPAGRVIHHRTIPTLLEAQHGPNLTQKIRFGFGPRGPALNFYVRPVFIDIFTSNGVVHAIDNILIPPPPTYFIFKLVPTVFSTFFQALHQTHVVKDFFPRNKSPSSWTAFVPGNLAWKKIPPLITAWLFSPRGHHILTKLVEYHISPNTTFYTDSIWKFPHPNKTEDFSPDGELPLPEDFPHPPHRKPPPHHGPPRRHHWQKLHFNTTLPTLIGGNATLRIDEFLFGPFVKIGINRRPGGIRVNDLLAYDGVVHILDRFVLPPRHRRGHRGEHVLVTGWAEEEDWTIENLEGMFGEM